MNMRSFCVGMGMGLMVGGGAMYMLRPKKTAAQRMIDRTRKAVDEVAEDLQNRMGL
ncbi:MAG: hypothetical protein IJV41_12990 [Oscillospiraceae bacterium]|nr:hypothetical protein [Oscillospiraceae bacterium]